MTNIYKTEYKRKKEEKRQIAQIQFIALLFLAFMLVFC